MLHIKISLNSYKIDHSPKPKFEEKGPGISIASLFWRLQIRLLITM